MTVMHQTTRRERVLAAFLANPQASIRELAAEAGYRTSYRLIAGDLQALAKDGLITIDEGARARAVRFNVAGYAAQWDADAAALGNPDA